MEVCCLQILLLAASCKESIGFENSNFPKGNRKFANKEQTLLLRNKNSVFLHNLSLSFNKLESIKERNKIGHGKA